MQVRIEQGTYREEVQAEKPRGWFAKQPPPTVYEGPCVRVFIELSEEEKAVVNEKGIGDDIIDEWKPSEEDERQRKQMLEEALRNERESMDEMNASTKGMAYSRREIEENLANTKRSYGEEWNARLKETFSVTLNEFLANPYEKRVKSEREGFEFIDRLKAEFLPKIKALILKFGETRPKTETFDL